MTLFQTNISIARNKMIPNGVFFLILLVRIICYSHEDAGEVFSSGFVGQILHSELSFIH